jgi:hypothetical protein
MDAYRAAVAAALGLPPQAVACKLASTSNRCVVEG